MDIIFATVYTAPYALVFVPLMGFVIVGIAMAYKGITLAKRVIDKA